MRQAQQVLPLSCVCDPTSGTRVDNTDATSGDVALRQHIAIVTQDTFLLHSSVLDNRLRKPGATREEIEAAARARFITPSRACRGYDTIVGERGYRFHRRTAIAIACAILKDPSILILDEATSALDAVATQSAEPAARGRTSLVIAHRSRHRDADRIVVMIKGRGRARHARPADGRNRRYAWLSRRAAISNAPPTVRVRRRIAAPLRAAWSSPAMPTRNIAI